MGIFDFLFALCNFGQEQSINRLYLSNSENIRLNDVAINNSMDIVWHFKKMKHETKSVSSDKARKKWCFLRLFTHLFYNIKLSLVSIIDVHLRKETNNYQVAKYLLVDSDRS